METEAVFLESSPELLDEVQHRAWAQGMVLEEFLGQAINDEEINDGP